jgi:hypothetical protein
MSRQVPATCCGQCTPWPACGSTAVTGCEARTSGQGATPCDNAGSCPAVLSCSNGGSRSQQQSTRQQGRGGGWWLVRVWCRQAPRRGGLRCDAGRGSASKHAIKRCVRERVRVRVWEAHVWEAHVWEAHVWEAHVCRARTCRRLCASWTLVDVSSAADANHRCHALHWWLRRTQGGGHEGLLESVPQHFLPAQGALRNVAPPAWDVCALSAWRPAWRAAAPVHGRCATLLVCCWPRPCTLP